MKRIRTRQPSQSPPSGFPLSLNLGFQYLPLFLPEEPPPGKKVSNPMKSPKSSIEVSKMSNTHFLFPFHSETYMGLYGMYS